VTTTPAVTIHEQRTAGSAQDLPVLAPASTPSASAPSASAPSVAAPSVAAGTAATKVPSPAVDRPGVTVPEKPAGITPSARPTQIFVDGTGRRRRWLRCLAYGSGLVGLVLTGLVAVSFVGGPVGPETVLPFIESTYRPEQISPNLRPTPGPTVSRSPGPGAAPSPG